MNSQHQQQEKKISNLSAPSTRGRERKREINVNLKNKEHINISFAPLYFFPLSDTHVQIAEGDDLMIGECYLFLSLFSALPLSHLSSFPSALNQHLGLLLGIPLRPDSTT